MKQRIRCLMKPGGLSLVALTHQWMSTLDYQAVYYEETADPAHPRFQGPAIYLNWHEHILFPFYMRSHCRIALLVSQHGDAEWLNEAARHMGFRTVRGSSYRGGSAALRELLRLDPDTNLAITPDGPRGPRRVCAPGAIYLSSKLGIPLVPVGFGYDRPWRLPTWDRFALPRPFSRARSVMGPRLWIPPDLSRAQVEHYRRLTETFLNELTDDAERWAVAGSRRAGQRAAERTPRPRPPFKRRSPPPAPVAAATAPRRWAA